MNIKRCIKNVSKTKIRKINDKSKFNCKGKINGGVCMENVITMDKYIETTQATECEWDIIQNICQKALKRKGITKDQIKETSERLLREVRSEK